MSSTQASSKALKKSTLSCLKQITSMQLSSLNVSGLANSTQHLYQTSNMLLLKRLTRMHYHLVHNLTREKKQSSKSHIP